jgi:preprotein translocase subunit SecG
MTFLFYLTLFLFIGVCAVLCLVILVQESKSMGLGASFGGDAGESLFGTSTAAVLKKFTAWIGVVFVVACVLLSIWSSIIAKKPASLPLSIEQTTTSPE